MIPKPRSEFIQRQALSGGAAVLSFERMYGLQDPKMNGCHRYLRLPIEGAFCA